MPITDHEKIRVHPRPCNDYLKAIPIKKRRFLFNRSPSPPPPPESRSPTQPDCDAPEVTHESLEPQSALPETGGNPSQVNIASAMTSSLSRELPSRKAEHSGIADSLLPKAEGHTGVVDSVTGQYASSECSKLPCLASADYGVAESKSRSSDPGASSPNTGGDLAEVNAAIPQNVSSQPCPKSTDCVASENKHGSSQLESSFPRNGDNFPRISNVKGEFDSHVPYAVLSPTPTDGIPVKRLESSGPDCLIPGTGGDHSKMNAVSFNNGSRASCEKLMNRNLDIDPKREILPTISDQVLGLNLVASSLAATSIAQEIALNMDGIQPCSRKTVLHSATEQTVEANTDGDGSKGKVSPNAGISLKQEELVQNLQSESTSAKFQADSLHLSLNRSNWDLNTPMDSWEGSSADFPVNDRTVDCDKQYPVGTQNQRLELGLEQILHTQLAGTDSVQGNCDLHKKDNHFKLPNPSLPMGDLNSKACLDLHLKPPILSKPCNMSVKLDTLKEMPFLSLATSPMLSSYTQFSIGRTVKSEPIESRLVDDGKVQTGILKPLELKHVKTEPNEGPVASKTNISFGKNSPCARVIKAEALGHQSQVCLNRYKESSLLLGLTSNQMTPLSSHIHLNAAIDNIKALYNAPKPSVVEHRVLHTEAEILDTCVDNVVPSNMVDKAEDMVDRDSIPENSRPITSTVITHAKNGVFTTPSNSHVTDQIDTNVLLEPCETSSLTLPILAKSLASDGEGHTTPVGKQALVVEKDLTNVNHFSNVMFKEEVLRNPCESSIMPLPLPAESLASGGEHTSPVGALRLAIEKDPANVMLKEEVLGNLCLNDKAVQSNAVEPTAGESSGVPEETSDSECKVDSCSDAAGAINTLQRRSGNEEDFEDGELRDLALSAAVEGSCGQTEEQHVNNADSVRAADLSVSMSMSLDVNDNKTESSEEVKASTSQEGDSVHEENKVESASASVGELAADSAEGKQNKTLPRILQDCKKNDGCCARRSKSPALSSKAVSSETQCEDADSRQLRAEESGQSDAADVGLQNSEQSDHAKDDTKCKPEISGKEGSTRDANFRGKNKRVVYLNHALKESATGKVMYIPSQVERGRPADRSFRCDRSQFRWSRDDFSNERSGKAESGRTYCRPVEKRGPNLLGNRSRVERKNSAYGDRNLLEHNKPGGARYSQHVNSAEDGPNRPARQIANEEMANMSCLPGRRRSTEGRLQMPMGRRPIRDVPDFALLAHEEKLRNMTEDMVEHPMQYERPDGMLIHRERRSLSPPMRRTGPIQLPPNCLRSPPRLRQRPKHQWSPPVRSTDGFSELRELRRCRSPPIMRLDMLQAPQEHQCFQEEMMPRRRGSPPYVARGPNRNPRRFNIIDPREIVEDEYVDPPMARNQIRDFGDGDEFVEERCDERRVPIRPFRQQHFAANDVDGENFRFHVEDGPPRRGGLRLRADGNENFPGGNNPRDFNARFRNRLGNSSGRLRSIIEEQEENYRHHEEQEWRDAPFHDNRPKRRRF